MAGHSKEEVKGFVVPIPTPFHSADGSPDEACLRELVDMYMDAKVDAFFVLGSFGNGPAMRPEERKRVAEVVLDRVNNRVPVLIQVGCPDPQTTAELGEHARDHGADGIAIVGPYYYNDRTDWEMVEHFRYIDQRVGLPILIYNNAEYQGYDITPQLMNQMRQAAPNIFGSKLAAGNTDRAKSYLAQLKQPFSAFIPANNFPEALVEGVKLAGTINPPLACFPELGVEHTNAFLSGDLLRLAEVHQRVGKFMAAVAPFKAHARGAWCEVLKARGIHIEQYPRWPSLPFTEEERRQLRANLAKTGFPVREAVAV